MIDHMNMYCNNMVKTIENPNEKMLNSIINKEFKKYTQKIIKGK